MGQIEKLCRLLPKFGVVSAKVDGIQLDFSLSFVARASEAERIDMLRAWANEALEGTPAPPPKPEERGPDGLTPTEADELYAST